MVDRTTFEQPSFRDVSFYVEESSTDTGRRIALHEYPLHDEPFPEDMGRRASRFSITGYVIGDDWETQRENLRAACEKNGPGKLIHPDFGEIQVVCDSCVITEDKIKSARKTTFEISFIEAGSASFPKEEVNTRDLLNDQFNKSIANISEYFKLAYDVARTPEFVTDSIQDVTDDLVGIVFNSLGVSGVGKFSDLKNSQSIIDDLTKTLDGVSNLEKSQSIRHYISISKITAPEIVETTSTRKKQRTARNLMLDTVKNFSALNLMRDSASVNYDSYQDAVLNRNEVLDVVDSQIKTAANTGQDKVFIGLRSSRAKYIDHITESAPSLKKIIYKNYGASLPSLVIAYDLYDDSTRDNEIVKRNHVRHPGFLPQNNLEVLNG